MMGKKRLKIRLGKTILGFFFAIIGVFGLLGNVLVQPELAYADPVNGNNNTSTSTSEGNGNNSGNSNNGNEANESTGNTESSENSNKSTTGDGCKDSMGPIGWLVCPTTGAIAHVIDAIYSMIQDILVVNPISTEEGTPIYEIWKYVKAIANIAFIIFLLVVIYSQITGVGITNYGIKKALPKLIIAAVLVNLSFLVCSLAVDLSNILGNSLRGVFTSIEEATLAKMSAEGVAMTGATVSAEDIFNGVVAGSIVVGGIAIAFETGAIWMMIPTLLGALVAVVVGLFTIALRQAVIVLLVMIAPLAVVAYILPNTDGLFKKWRKLFVQMLVFYPMFSLLFGASSLAGFAIIANAQTGFGILLGLAVQIFPIFFAWKLMQMSGTFLGDINAKLAGIAAIPVVASRGMASARRDEMKARRIANGRTPYSWLQRAADNRRALRETNLASMKAIRRNEASVYVQKKIGGGYDGKKAKGTEAFLKPNKYTRIAKDLSNSSMAAETAEADTKHVISNYGNYFVSEKVRNRVKAAEEANDERTLRKLRKTDVEYRRAAEGATNFLEYKRAMITAQNDEEADLGFMVDSFVNANNNRDRSPEDMAKYNHYIASAAGGLGKEGEERVLGRVLAQAASVESARRRDARIVAEKYNHDKLAFRHFLINYKTDADGYAVDVNGNKIEEHRGYLLRYHPEKLVLWDKVEDGKRYFDWYDGDKFVTRVYDTDKAMIKELLSGFDAPINDPINNLYGILAGVKPGEIGLSQEAENQMIRDGVSLDDIQKKREGLAKIGLEGYRTTIGRALMGFKEKNAAFSPMVKEMIARGYINNYAQEYLAYLDSLTKATKPGGWNVQDRDAVQMFATIMDPSNWDEAFPTELIREYRNVDGKPITGTRYDANGNKIKVPAEQATREELMNTVREKFLEPALKKMPAMTRRMTPNMVENQKPEVVRVWKELFAAVDKCGRELGINPYDGGRDMGEVIKDIRQKYDRAGTVNHHVVVDEMQIDCNGDPDEFARSFAEHCDQYPELARARRDFDDYVAGRRYSATVDELYDFAVQLLDSYTNLD